MPSPVARASASASSTSAAAAFVSPAQRWTPARVLSASGNSASNPASRAARRWCAVRHVPSVVVPDESSCPTGKPSPPKRFGRFDVAAREGRDRFPNRWRSGHRSVDDQRRETVEEQVDGTGRRCGGRGECRPGHLLAVSGPRQATREQCRGQCVEVRLARERHVQRLESACRREQEWRHVAPAVGRERDPRPEDLCLGALEVVERAGIGILEKRDGVVDGACLVLGLGGGQRPAGASRGIDRQRRRTFEECRGSGEPATRLGARSGTFEVSGDIFVRHDRCLRSVPGATIRVGLGIGRVRESLMHLGPLADVGGSIHRGANERMPEGNAWPERDQAARLRCEGR